MKTFVYVGSGDWDPSELGLVTVYELDRQTQTLSWVSEHAAGDLASYLAIDEAHHRLFVADEVGGGVINFSIDPQTGSLINRGPTVSGNHPVYLSIAGDFLLAANYSEGSVDVFPIGRDGTASPPTQNVLTGDQAHCVVVDVDGHAFVANKGSNSVSHFSFSGGMLTASTPASTDLASPRHIFLGRDSKAYVVSEEADLLTAYRVKGGGELSPLWQVPRLPASGSAMTDTGGDVRVTPNGDFLYATNRGSQNTIVGFDLRGNAPVPLAHQSSQGTTPRNFTIDPQGEFLIVANHGTDKSLAIFRIGSDGHLELSEVLPLAISPFFVGLARF